MLKNFFVIILLGAFCIFLYGIANIFLEVEENACRMTYMFGYPQFSRVRIKENPFPNYGLYYYYEGNSPRDVNNLRLDGAPVIFVPGNGGSHKQARSLASVALRKAMDDNRIKLDYFTISYNEELSALYGGYLENQKEFLKICIQTVLKLYENVGNVQKKIVLIGHSMGGKVAQAILMENDISHLINTIIFIASPLDMPVVNIDVEINSFYERTNEFLLKHRSRHTIDNDTNICSNVQQKLDRYSYINVSAALDNVLLISIGGGNRDLLVRSGLTSSQFSDIHAMTSSIPNVWLSCDHLSSVWCLQLVLAINRFLFSISLRNNQNYVVFNNDKFIRTQAAINFFVKTRSRTTMVERDFVKASLSENSWHEDTRRVFSIKFKNGLRRNYNQMFQLDRYKKYKKLLIEVINLDFKDWLFGCTALRTTSGKHICENGTSLSHYIQSVPTKDKERFVASLDIKNIRNTFENWTHVVLRLPPTNKQVSFNVDAFDPNERDIYIKTPRWFDLSEKYFNNETVQGTIYYKMLIKDLHDSFQAIQVNIKPLACIGKSYHVTSKICTPWAPGFTRYHIITENNTNTKLFVNAPISSTTNYNNANNHIVLEMYLDPGCRYSISYQFSIAATLSRIVQQFYHWLPSHLCAVLFIVLKNQITKFYTQPNFKFSKPYTGFFQYTSLYLITGCRIFKKLLLPLKFLPQADVTNYSYFVSFIVHSTAIAISIIVSFIIWMLLVMNGNFIYKFAERLTKLSSPVTSVLVSIIGALPITFGVLTISIALGSCSGIALVLACAFYFIMISNAYKDYLENWFWESATNLIKKTCTSPNTSNSQNEENLSVENSSANGEEANGNNSAENTSQCIGKQNFPFHITLFLLLCICTFLNFGVTIAWIKNYRNQYSLSDPSLTPVIFILLCISLLWQLDAPKKFSIYRYGYKIISFVLYICASACVLYCQEAIYRLNYMIAFVYALILTMECIGRLWSLYAKNN